jgi:hypothetical protein
MKKSLLTILAALLLSGRLLAGSPPDEGMWLPMFVERLNHVDMQKMGLRLTAAELYSINNSSLKDAIVGLGSGSAPSGYFCTSELVSPNGLLLTNHHCAYDAIQSHSTPEHDYLTNGFWAYKMDEELPNQGMTASVLVRMEDVTARVFAAVDPALKGESREAAISEIMETIEKEASDGGKLDPVVKAFFEGNEYYLFVYRTFRDVRLVGAPPSSIGKFGGDTDNWMWPRHTGDFSMLRVYTAPDGTPADYSKENIPMKPAHYLPISIKGVQKNDFAMIWGFPGTTDRYLTSHGVKMAIEESNPTTVKIRDVKLDIMRKAMESDPAIRIQYASKYASTANYWKYYIGQTRGLKRLKVYDNKLATEKRFEEWVNSNPGRKEKYGQALPLIESAYKELAKTNLAMTYLNEAVFQGPECYYFTFQTLSVYSSLRNLEENKKDPTQSLLNKAVLDATVAEARKLGAEHFKNYHQPTDIKQFAELMKMYYDNVPAEYHPKFFAEVMKKYKGDWYAYANAIFAKSLLTDPVRFNAFLDNPSLKLYQKDPVFKITLDMIITIRGLYAANEDADRNLAEGNRLFVDGLRSMDSDLVRYPNANSTLRMTYGKVGDYYPADAVHYDYVTTLEGIMEKEDPSNDEFVVPAKLKELYAAKDYGRYADKSGKMVVGFITNTDITGGNSGSPVMNGDGHLIGIAFDGNWEAMSGDIAFEPELQRTISVDIRYVLFIIDKMAGAKNLINEMTIIE